MKRRHKRIAFIVVGLAGLGIATYLVASAFRNNLVFFFSPTQVAAKEATINKTFRGAFMQIHRRWKIALWCREIRGGDNTWRISRS